MKFSVEKTLATGGRLGLITHAGRHGNVTMETPMCTLFTKGGSAPHLSVSMLQRVAGVPAMAAMSLGGLADHHESVAQQGQGLAEFTAMKNHLVFSTLQDSSMPVQSGKNDKSGVAVWGKGGKIKLDVPLYMAVQESFQPDWFQALSDGDTDADCARKRLTKAVDRTLDFLDEIVDRWQKSDKLKNSCLFGVVEGGYNKDERSRSAKETAMRPVDGFVIEGFEKGNSGKDLFDHDEFTSILSHTLGQLPESKPRVMETVWSPLQVIQAFRLGVDVFSSSYPHTLTSRGHALVADYTLPPRQATESSSTSPSSQLSQLEVSNASNENSSNSTTTTNSNSTNSSSKDSLPTSGFIIDLNHSRYSTDFGPVMPGCSCYTCSQFTRAYIHHLLNTSELLAYVLLTIHNFHQYFDFFTHLRHATQHGTLDQLETSLTQQHTADTHK